jgi:hypothetical protein
MFSAINLPDKLYTEGFLAEMEKSLESVSVVPCIF